MPEAPPLTPFNVLTMPISLSAIVGVASIFRGWAARAAPVVFSSGTDAPLEPEKPSPSVLSISGFDIFFGIAAVTVGGSAVFNSTQIHPTDLAKVHQTDRSTRR